MEIHRNIWLSRQNFFEPGYWDLEIWGLEFETWNLELGIYLEGLNNCLSVKCILVRLKQIPADCNHD